MLVFTDSNDSQILKKVLSFGMPKQALELNLIKSWSAQKVPAAAKPLKLLMSCRLFSALYQKVMVIQMSRP